MKSKHLIKTLFSIIIIITNSCTSKTNDSDKNTISGDTLNLKYATNISIIDYPDYSIVNIRDPWDSLNTLRTYILIDNKQNPDYKKLPEGIVISTPLRNMLVYSAVHCGLMEEIGALNQIGGVCDLQYICEGKIHERVAEGYITDCGNAMSPDIEKIIDLNPDAILLSPYENSNNHSKTNKLNIPIIECADYMETSPLGRAEWMRFYGRLTGKASKADSLFKEIENKYVSLRNKTSKIKNKPTVMSELKTGSVWYVPGGGSTTGKLFADAGARYIFGDTKPSGSLALDFETVLEKGQTADFWFITYNQKYNKTLKQLQADFNGYSLFNAFKQQKIFGCNTACVPYYEEVPFHPEIILSELISIIHPDITLENNDSMRFFNRIEKE